MKKKLCVLVMAVGLLAVGVTGCGQKDAQGTQGIAETGGAHSIRLSQLDSGNAKDLLEIVNLAEIAKESVEMLSLEASKRQVELRYEGEKEADVRIGRELAQELVYNLLQNAIRYNKPGGKVLVRTLIEGKKVIFCIEDNGIGIPPEHQGRIFERFYRVDKSRSKELGGTGLGLAIVKHICDLTAGEISLLSEPGAGTTISVSWEMDGKG